MPSTPFLVTIVLQHKLLLNKKNLKNVNKKYV